MREPFASRGAERYSTKIVPSIEFMVNFIGRAKKVDAPDGGELVDICDEYLAPIPFSCRSASCGTCHVQVLEGAELLEPPDPAEAELLSLLGGGPGHRLACQARVRGGAGVIRLRAVLGG
ncbi:MAG: 2Fe-2S iron-sulfur cluster-binding protein [Polyangiaceae bacterium]